MSTSTTVLSILAAVAIGLAPGCVNSFKGEDSTESFDEAAVIVSAYQIENLPESEFLGDWPDLEHRPGDKEGWLWGILETTDSSTKKQESRSYVVGYMESDVATYNVPSTPIYTVTDSAGAVTSRQDFKTVSSENWFKHPVWRFDFQDSVLVAIDLIGAP